MTTRSPHSSATLQLFGFLMARRKHVSVVSLQVGAVFSLSLLIRLRISSPDDYGDHLAVSSFASGTHGLKPWDHSSRGTFTQFDLSNWNKAAWPIWPINHRFRMVGGKGIGF